MAVIKKRPEFEHSEQAIIKQFIRDYNFTKRYEIILPNCYTQHDNEADLFAIRKSGFCDEFEIKISRSDFLADSKKEIRYREYEAGEYRRMSRGEPDPALMPKRDALLYGFLSNYFSYAVKEGIASVEEVPEQFGFITVDDRGRIRVIRGAKRLHPVKMPVEKRYQIARKLSFRYLDLLRR